jgi:hypothetical protein
MGTNGMNIGSTGATNYFLADQFYAGYTIQRATPSRTTITYQPTTTAKYLGGETFFMAVSNCSFNTPARTEDKYSPYPYVVGVTKTDNTLYYDVKTSKCVDFCLSDTFQNTISKVC